MSLAEDKINDAFMNDFTVVHIVTDDPTYRNHYRNIFPEDVEAGRITFGPTTSQERIREGASWTNHTCRFVRETATRTAIVEWLCLAQCTDCYFTKGSTVTHFVRAMNESMFGTVSFGTTEEIGAWDVGSTPTTQFKNDMRRFVQSNLEYMEPPTDAQISHPQRQVLNFLTPAHLTSIYETLKAFLDMKDGTAKASDAGQYLSTNCRAAQLNRDKYKKTERQEGGWHWLKALVKTTLFQHCWKDETATSMIYWNDDTLELYDVPKETSTSYTSSSSSSSGFQRPPTKRFKSD